MRVIKWEIKKLLNPVLFIVLLLFAVIFFLLFCVKAAPDYSMLYTDFEDINKSSCLFLIEKYGNSLTPEKHKDLTENYLPQKLSELQNDIKNNTAFSNAGITDLESYEKFCDYARIALVAANPEVMSDENFSKTYEGARESYVLTQAQKNLLGLTSNIGSAEFELSHRLQVLTYTKRSFEGDSTYLRLSAIQERNGNMYKGSAARERWNEIFDSGEIYNLNTEGVIQSVRDNLYSASLLSSVLFSLIFICSLVTRDRNTVSVLQQTSKTGRKIYKKQFLSMLFVSGIISVGIILFFIIKSFIDVPEQFFRSGLNSYENIYNFSFYKGSMLSYLFVAAFLIFVFNLTAACVSFIISVKSKSLITLLFRAVPCAVVFAVLSSVFHACFFMKSDGELSLCLYKYIPLPYVEAVFITALFAIAFIASLNIIRTKKKSEII